MTWSSCYVSISIGICGPKYYIDFGDKYLKRYEEVDSEIKYLIYLCFLNL